MESSVHSHAEAAPVLRVSDLGVVFPGTPHPTVAVEGVSLSLWPGQITGVLGESGSGKSQFARALTRLTRGAVSGAVYYGDADIAALPERALGRIRGGRIAYVFQDPMTSLSPYLRISVQMAEVAERHLGLTRKAALARAEEMLTLVRIPEPAARLRNYPHELSGGMRQRVTIAMAMMADPEVLIADEPTTALDATVQIQVLDLLRELCDRKRLAILIITHDISVLARIADAVMVLYAGRAAEYGPVAQVLAQPFHPYTRGLMDSTPDLDKPQEAGLQGIPGSLPGPDAARQACLFRARCFRAEPRCGTERPVLRAVADGRHMACHFPLGGPA